MDDLLYDQLTDALNQRGGAFPAIKCQVFRDLMEAVFSDEDARLAVEMPILPVTTDEMADRMKKDLGGVRNGLDAMARKGILFTTQTGEKRIYVLLPLIPGILENQMMKGETDERTREIARLFTEYLAILMDLEKSGSGLLPKIPFARVIAINEDIPADISVQPYDRLLDYLDKAGNFALAVCHCRHMYELMGDPCSKPKDVCLAVGPGAQYMIDYGLAKAISKEEALTVLKRAEDAGLVHVVSNTGKNIDFICNCCSCHCDNLRAFKRRSIGGRAAPSSFIAEVKAEVCTGCGNCITRCPMEALTMNDDLANVRREDCIGCGLCVSTCPTEAIVLTAREQSYVPYADARQLNKAIISSIKSSGT